MVEHADIYRAPGPTEPHGKPFDAARALDELCQAHERLDTLHYAILHWIHWCRIPDLSPLQVAILYILSRGPQQPSRPGMALFHRDRPLAYPLKPLLSRGLIEERPHRHDGRAKLLHVTPTGLAVLRRFGVRDEAMTALARIPGALDRPTFKDAGV